MEVTKQNFKSVLETVLTDIDECDFVSLDGEFTGISHDGYKASPLDTVEERYYKLRQGNMNYLMLQTGLCMFKKHESTYNVKPYNFYVLPRPLNRSTAGPEFVFQTSCMEFLAAHGFDFNKVFREGITFLKSEEENVLKDKIQESCDKVSSPYSSTPITNIKEEDLKYIDEVKGEIEKYLADSERKEPLNLKPCSAFRRKLTYQQINKTFGDDIKLTAAGTSVRFIQVTKLDKLLSKHETENLHKQKQLEELDELVGFSQVVRKLSQSRKLIIGHNMLLDLMYIIHQFIDDLPNNYSDFKTVVKSLFPQLIDTKTMSSTSLFKDSIPFNSLDEMITQLESTSNKFSQIPIQIVEGFPNYNAGSRDSKTSHDSTSRDVRMSQQFHDAAYDAFVTGKSFLIMINHLANKATPPITQLTSDTRLLSPFLGKLNLHRIQDVPYLNLYGEEVKPNRENVFHLTIPKIWNKSDLYQLFSPYTIHLYWQNDTEVLISVNYKNESDLKKIKRLVMSHISQSAKVMSYNDWLSCKTRMAEKQKPDITVVRETAGQEARKHAADSNGSEDRVSNKRQRTFSNQDANTVTSKTGEGVTDVNMTDDSEKDENSSSTDKLFEEESWT